MARPRPKVPARAPGAAETLAGLRAAAETIEAMRVEAEAADLSLVDRGYRQQVAGYLRRIEVAARAAAGRVEAG